MEGIYWEPCGIPEGPHMWPSHALSWSPFYFWRFFLKGAHVEDSSCYFLLLSLALHMWILFHLLFWNLTTSFLMESFIYLAPCTFIYVVGFLGIHTCVLVACILWTSCYFWRRWLWSILLRGLLYVVFSHASWRWHLVSSLRWILECILICP
jgi:hypothetical protein